MARYLIDPFVFVDVTGLALISDSVTVKKDSVLAATGGDGGTWLYKYGFDDITETVTVDDTATVLIVDATETFAPEDDPFGAYLVTDTATIDDTWTVTPTSPSETFTPVDPLPTTVTDAPTFTLI